MKTKTRLLWLLVASLVSVILAACDSDQSAPPQVEGPALLLFYTDN